MYKVICMSFDGEYQTESPEFETVNEAWDYSGDLGSKWYFYPFHFVVKNQTVKDSPEMMEFLNGKRIKTVSRLFKRLSEREEAHGMDCESFMFYVIDNV